MFIKLAITETTYNHVKSAFSREFGEDYYVKYPARATLPEVLDAEFEEALGVFEDGDVRRVLRCGYYVTNSVARYTTSRGNTWGVVKTPHGECYAVFIGRRSRARDLEATLKAAGVSDPCRLRVAEYRTTGPVGMMWWEDRAMYTLRHDDLNVAAIMAGPDWDECWEWCRDVERKLRWTPDRLARITKMVALTQKAEATKYRRQAAMG